MASIQILLLGFLRGRMGGSFAFSLVLLWLALLFPANGNLVDDKQALLDFINEMPHLHGLNWTNDTSVCSDWIGVTCNAEKSRVIAVRLPAVGFSRPIPANTLSRLSALQILNLKSNRINGAFPSDLTNLGNLSMLYLQSNNFSGPLPANFSAWNKISVLDLSSNRFNGSIPRSISNLSHLAYLKLSNNSLSGQIPDFASSNLHRLNLSYNNLSGSIPISFSRFSNAAFLGNSFSPPIPPPSFTTKRKPKKPLEIIISGVCILVLVTIIFILLIYSRNKRKNRYTAKFSKSEMSPGRAIPGGEDAKNKLVFFEGCNSAFDLEDLLRASAEVLGKGGFGMSYKAILEDANVVVVKRLKDVSAGRREFEQQMAVIGSVRHKNVVAVRAYYYSKDEKLMVIDHCCEGSVCALLHGNRGDDRIPLDWETRLRIAIGAARGIAHIHLSNAGRLAHGNIRSSNIFLGSNHSGCVSDFGLATLMSPMAPSVSRAHGYRAPEVADTRRATHASDVYSFGVFLLELLTGRSPVHSTGGDEMVHLVRWVHSVVREEWTGEVFDVELMRYPNIEEEMVEMLQIAMSCVVRVPDQRPKMLHVVKLIENVRQLNI